jgi:hypothetical protein
VFANIAVLFLCPVRTLIPLPSRINGIHPTFNFLLYGIRRAICSPSYFTGPAKGAEIRMQIHAVITCTIIAFVFSAVTMYLTVDAKHDKYNDPAGTWYQFALALTIVSTYCFSFLAYFICMLPCFSQNSSRTDLCSHCDDDRFSVFIRLHLQILSFH